MKIFYEVDNRKPLVKALSEFTGEKSRYLYTPTYAYRIGKYTVNKHGSVLCDDETDRKELKALVKFLAEKGFTPKHELYLEEEPAAEEPTANEPAAEEQPPETEDAPAAEDTALAIAFPLERINLGNLENLLEAKGALIQKALGICHTDIETDEEKVSFPWFKAEDAPLPEAFLKFLTALCQMSLTQKRVSSKAKNVENEKYAFRCFLLRLGFIGKEYKEDRKLLLKNFTGSSAFKNGGRKVKSDAVSE